MDALILQVLWSWRLPLLDQGFAAVTWLGSVVVLLPLAAALAWRLAGPARWFPLAGLAGGVFLGHAGKQLFERPRPELFHPLVTMPADWSFPSAHTLQVTALVAAWLLRPGARPGAGEIAAGTLLVVLVGMSRLYLQVHWPSDVLAGLVLGLLWILFLRRLPAWEAKR